MSEIREAYEERAAVRKFDAGMSREAAEWLALQDLLTLGYSQAEVKELSDG